MNCPSCNREPGGISVRCRYCGMKAPLAVHAGGRSSINGLDPNMGALFCYLGFFVTGIIFYLLEKESRFVRFHALQSLVTFGGITALLLLIRLPFPGARLAEVLYMMLLLGALVLWVLLMLKAYQGEEFEVPLVGDWLKEYL